MREGLTYDDVLLIPKKATLNSRADAGISLTLQGGIRLDIPVFSASMDSVTGSRMAESMSDSGGRGIIHRFCSVDDQCSMVEETSGRTGAAVGISSSEIDDRVPALIDAGVEFLCVDVAHGHMESCIDAIHRINECCTLPLMAGAVATREGTKDLAAAGVDMVRVGVGPGSSCLTRERAGVGVPQITAIQDACRSPYDVSIIADGGVKKPGDIVKALMAGADGVVVGGQLASCQESLAEPVWKGGKWYKKVRGMASEDAQRDYGRDDIFVEGDTYLTELDGTVSDRMEQFEKGIRSGVSYCGGHDIESARDNAEFIKISSNTVEKNGVHGG